MEEVPQYPPPAPTTGDLHISSPTTSEVEEPMIASSPAEEAPLEEVLDPSGEAPRIDSDQGESMTASEGRGQQEEQQEAP